MNLTPQMYQEITESINVISRDEPRVGDRRAPRVKLSSQLSVAMWEDPTANMSVRVRDMSAGGIGLFHNQRIALDEQLVVSFPQKTGNKIMLLSKVIYWEPLSENLYAVGVQFERVVQESDLVEQANRSTAQQIHQIGLMARFTQAFARTWRIAS